MKPWIKSMIIFLLCMAMVGCGSDVNELKDKKSKSAMGRYIEESNELEEKIDDSIEVGLFNQRICFWHDHEGNLEALIRADKFINYELTGEGTWQQKDFEWCQMINKDHPEIDTIKFIKAGEKEDSYYILGNMKLSAYISENKLNDISLPREINKYTIQNMDIDKEGNIYFYNQDIDAVQKINTKGELEGEIDHAGYSISILGDKLATLSFGKVSIYNKNDMKLEKEIEGIGSHASTDIIFNDGKEAFYVPLSGGLYRIDQSGEMVEQIIDGNLCALASNSVDQAIYDKGIFYMSYWDAWDKKAHVKSYTYKSDEPALPAKELVIWGAAGSTYSLEKIASLYRMQHPDTYVKVEDLYAETDGYYDNCLQINADDLDQFNTELLAGKGPDIILLDSLNYEKYEEQGMFEDLSSLVTKWESEIPLLHNMVTSYSNQEKIFAIPLNFTIIRGIGDRTLLDKGFSFNQLADYQIQQGKKILFKVEAPRRALAMADFCKEQLLLENGKVNEEAIKTYLIQIKEVSGKTEHQIFMHDWRTDFNTSIGIKEKAIKADLDKIGSLTDIQHLLWLKDQDPNFMVTQLVEGKENLAEGRRVLAINKNSKNKEGAEAFIHLGLSEEMQSFSQYDGLPVNENSLKEALFPNERKVMHDGKVKYEGNQLVDSDSVEFNYGHEKEMQTFLEECKTAQINRPIDEKIRKIIYDETVAYDKNEESLEEAVENIKKKVNLYLSEQGK